MTPSLLTFVPATQLPLAIDNSQLVLQDMLGVGAYGSVYRAIDTQTLQNYAVKSLNKAGLDSHQSAFQNHEAQLHALVSGHPNIVTLHKVVEENDCLHMVLECGMEGDLFCAITERGGYVGNTMAIKAIFSQITSAVLHCHSRGVYHRDLKVTLHYKLYFFRHSWHFYSLFYFVILFFWWQGVSKGHAHFPFHFSRRQLGP